MYSEVGKTKKEGNKLDYNEKINTNSFYPNQHICFHVVNDKRVDLLFKVKHWLYIFFPHAIVLFQQSNEVWLPAGTHKGSQFVSRQSVFFWWKNKSICRSFKTSAVASAKNEPRKIVATPMLLKSFNCRFSDDLHLHSRRLCTSYNSCSKEETSACICQLFMGYKFKITAYGNKIHTWSANSLVGASTRQSGFAPLVDFPFRLLRICIIAGIPNAKVLPKSYICIKFYF